MYTITYTPHLHITIDYAATRQFIQLHGEQSFHNEYMRIAQQLGNPSNASWSIDCKPFLWSDVYYIPLLIRVFADARQLFATDAIDLTVYLSNVDPNIRWIVNAIAPDICIKFT